MSVNGVSLVYLDASEESGLIESAQSGNREAYLRLVRHYQKPMIRAAYSMARDPEKAETLTRDAFLRAWQRIHDFPRGQRFFPWLLRAARGLFPTPPSPAFALAAMDAVVSEDGMDGVELPSRSADGTDPESGALAAFAELRPDEQMALSMRLLEKISYEEIGAILDLSLGVVTLRLSQARGHLLPRAEALPRDAA